MKKVSSIIVGGISTILFIDLLLEGLLVLTKILPVRIHDRYQVEKDETEDESEDP